MSVTHQGHRSRAPATSGWPGLFWEAFRRSRNPMVLLDDERRHVEVNGAYLQLLGYSRDYLLGRPVYEMVVGGPLLSAPEWHALLLRRHFTGRAELQCADGRRVKVDLAGHPEVVTGRQLVLFVVVHTARSTRRLDSVHDAATPPGSLSRRELEVVHLIALGLDGPEIATELHLSHNTVRTHVRNAMVKTGARSRAHLVAKALGSGLAWQEE